jgi:hypothetical protein
VAAVCDGGLFEGLVVGTDQAPIAALVPVLVLAKLPSGKRLRRARCGENRTSGNRGAKRNLEGCACRINGLIHLKQNAAQVL